MDHNRRKTLTDRRRTRTDDRRALSPRPERRHTESTWIERIHNSAASAGRREPRGE
jgi:hypothetical protein